MKSGRPVRRSEQAVEPEAAHDRRPLNRLFGADDAISLSTVLPAGKVSGADSVQP